jgi:hypothetical protein
MERFLKTYPRTYGDVGCMKADDELAKYKSSRSHARGRGMIFPR